MNALTETVQTLSVRLLHRNRLLLGVLDGLPTGVRAELGLLDPAEPFAAARVSAVVPVGFPQRPERGP